MKNHLKASPNARKHDVTWFIVFAVLALSCTTFFAACGDGMGSIACNGPCNPNLADRVPVTAGNAAQPTALSTLQVAAIELPSNLSTGYRWGISQLDDDKLQVLGSEFIQEEGDGLLGAGGKEIFYVAGLAPGKASISLDYARPLLAETTLTSAQFTFQLDGQLERNFEPPTAEDAGPVIDSDVATMATLPAHYSWCENNGCTAIRDQGNCGGCWAFATVAPFEGALKIDSSVTANLSEQYLISCNSEGWGCNGGWWGHDYHVSKKVSGETAAGAVLETVFPYKASDAACNPPHAKAYKLQSWAYVGGASSVPSTTSIKNALYTHGPLSVGVCVNNGFQNYSSGVFTGPSCTGVNHGVTLVGWDDTDGAWIMRNSWGTSWGESGYMRIKYGVSQIGYAAAYVVYSGGGGTSTPTASFTTKATGLKVTFTNTSTDSGSTIQTNSWKFGDSRTSTTKSPTHTYKAAGTYSVTLKVTDANSQTNSVTKSVTVP